MRKLNRSKPLSREYVPLVLWADDIEEVMSALKGCEEVMFVADDVQYDSVDEFVRESKGRRPTKVSISTERPYVTVELFPLWAKLDVSALSVSHDEILALGIFKKIDTILSRRERKPNFAYKPLLLVAIAFIVIAASHLALPEFVVYTFQAISFCIVGWMIIGGYTALKRHAVVHPFFSSSAPSFVEKNRDAIVALTSALVGAIFGALAAKAVDRVWPNAPSPIGQSLTDQTRSGAPSKK